MLERGQMSRSKKSRRSRPRSKKTRQSHTSGRTHPKDGRLLFSVSKTGLPQIRISMDNMPQFLIKAKAAIDAERTAEAIDILNDEGVEVIRKIVDKDPSRTDVMLALAVMLCKTGQLLKAEEWYKKILEQESHALIYNELARICRFTGRLSQATQYRRKAMEAEPNNAIHLSNLGCDLIRAGQKQESIDLLRKAVERAPGNAAIHSSLLFYLHHLPNLDPQTLFDEHKRWGQIHAPISRARVSHDNVPDPDRRLRVGYVSPDFCAHSVAYFFESLLGEHDAAAVETYGYGNVVRPDKFTERIKRKLDHYRNVSGVDDKTIANMVETDQIDILVDLAGHTASNNLPVFAYKPAPIQVTYLGYPDTTGMQQIDYRLTDKLADPPQSQQFYTEELVFLPDGFLCYRTPGFGSAVAPLPAGRSGYITFGSFNNGGKISLFLIALWAQILNANGNSRLLLKFNGGGDQEVKDRYLRGFEQFGIGRERVIIMGQRAPVDHLKLYGLVDIALDTYPYNGATTTCEALWMGVPVVSLAGRCHVSRVGLSILSRVGLESFVASTPSEYLAKATALAAKPDALAKIRASMRKRIADSTLCDAKRFTHNVEGAYRKMWHRWCQSQGVDVTSAEVKLDAPHICTDAVACHAQSKPAAAKQGEKTYMTRRLHIGGQLRHPDWEVFNIQPGPHVDHVGDAKDLSLFEDETFDELYASHVVEHFDYNGPLLEAFKEWYRILKPEGKLYISVPNMDVLCQLFRKRKELELKDRFQVMRMMFGGHIDQYDYHYVGLDFDILTAFLGQAKFKRVKHVEDLGVFQDTSTLRLKGVPISLNIIAFK